MESEDNDSNISPITKLNELKDSIDTLGCVKGAADTMKELEKYQQTNSAEVTHAESEMSDILADRESIREAFSETEKLLVESNIHKAELNNTSEEIKSQLEEVNKCIQEFESRLQELNSRHENDLDSKMTDEEENWKKKARVELGQLKLTRHDLSRLLEEANTSIPKFISELTKIEKETIDQLSKAIPKENVQEQPDQQEEGPDPGKLADSISQSKTQVQSIKNSVTTAFNAAKSKFTSVFARIKAFTDKVKEKLSKATDQLKQSRSVLDEFPKPGKNFKNNASAKLN